MEKQVHQLMIFGFNESYAHEMVNALSFIAKRSPYSFDGFFDLYVSMVAQGFADYQTVLHLHYLGIPLFNRSETKGKEIQLKDVDTAIMSYYENLKS